MVYVVVLSVLLFLGGLAVIGLMGVRVLRRVNTLKRAVAKAATEIGEATERVEQLRPAQRP